MKTVLYLWLLLGILPALAIWGIIEFSLRFLGSRSWPDEFAFIVFGGLYLGLIGGGAYLFTHTRS